ncbi:MAG: hypothetical protein JWR67_2174 [Mucilaginibacter sp.]|nr:hypothetical protein [Mucilaginibacter sp.]
MCLHTLKVSTENVIRLQYVEIISVCELTVEQTTSKIRKNMGEIYPGLLTGRTDIVISAIVFAFVKP